MAKAPPGAMSSPYNQGGEFSEMLKSSAYFKDATYNMEQKFCDLSDEKKAEILAQEQAAKADVPAQASTPAIPVLKFTPEKKNELVKTLVGQGAEIVSVNDEMICVKMCGQPVTIRPE